MASFAKISAWRKRWPRAASVVVCWCFCLAAAPAFGQFFEVPEGFAVEKNAAPPATDEWRPLETIRPATGPFSKLSSIELRQVTSTIDDADAWLKARLTVDFADEDDVEDLLSSPDSPFADPAFDALRDAIPELFRGLKQLGKMPLDFCQGPVTAYNAAGELREIFCVYQVGPIRQYITLRLQNVGNEWFYTEIRAMNERRLRHLVAIANSFRVAE
jgi:hypothetical protein